MELYEADSGREVGHWQESPCGKRVRIGEVEVEAHNAGHVLGSAQCEVITPEGTIVYASHLGLDETSLTRRAEVVPCDLLVIEAPFATVHQNERESVVADIVKWALECVNDHRIPALISDPIGHAQELVRTFNLWTKIPVIVHPRIARLNQVYENHGTSLHYLDASTEEAVNLVEGGQCIVIVPKRFDTTRYGNFRVATVSDRAARFEGGDDGQRVFPLNTQPDLNQLLEYVKEVKPRSVLTFYGASAALAQMISNRLDVPARQVTSERPARKPQKPKVDERRMLALQEILMRFIETPGYMYDRRDIASVAVNKGFRSVEIEEALERLTKNGKLEYSRLADGYTLTSA